VSLSQLAEARDRVRSFGGYNNSSQMPLALGGTLVQVFRSPVPSSERDFRACFSQHSAFSAGGDDGRRPGTG